MWQRPRYRETTKAAMKLKNRKSFSRTWTVQRSAIHFEGLTQNEWLNTEQDHIVVLSADMKSEKCGLVQDRIVVLSVNQKSKK